MTTTIIHTNAGYTEVRTLGRPWSAYGRGINTYGVSPDGTVSVYDDIAGHYTLCHAMTEAQQRRIRKLAGRPA